MECPDNLPRIPGRHRSPVDAAAADSAQQVTGDRASTCQARYACCGIIEVVGAGLICVLMHIALHCAPLTAKSKRVMAVHFIYDVIDDPGWAGRYVAGGRACTFRHRRETLAKIKSWKGVGAGSTWHLRQLPNESQIDRTITFIAVQISNRDMVGERGGERVLPVEARNRRVLWPCGQFISNRNGKLRRGVVARELPPPEEVEVVLVAVVVVDSEHVHIAVCHQGVRNRPR